MTKKINLLTRREAEVMVYLWNLPNKGGYTNDILNQYDPKERPAYTTLATFLKILVNKGYVKAVKEGSMLFFTPKVSKLDYFRLLAQKQAEDFFGGSAAQMIDFLIKEAKLTDEEKGRLKISLE